MREQLLKAGFTETKAKKNNRPKQSTNKATTKSANKLASKQTHPNAAKSSQQHKGAQDQAAIAERKRIKAQIKAIIDADKLDEIKGDFSHSYVVGKRIKQLFVNEATRKQLVNGELVITRLNGATFIVPLTTGDKIKQLNPDWVVIKPAESSDDESGDYADYQVPDDLQW